MKYIYIIIDGLPDDNYLDGKTPVETASANNLHEISKKSTPLLVQTIYRYLPIGSIVANLGLLGYNPYTYFPHGRSYFELKAIYDGNILENDLIFRCNIISVDQRDNILDFTANQINDKLANKIIKALNKKLPENYELFHGKNYRNSLLIKNSHLKPSDILTFEPHSRKGENIFDLRVKHTTTNLNQKQRDEIRMINSVMFSSIMMIKEIVNDPKIDMLWFWAPSQAIKLDDFNKRNKIESSYLIAGSDFLHGISKCANIDFKRIGSFTGEAETDYRGKGELALKKLKENKDFLYIHINATDELSHQRDFIGKVNSINEIDSNIIKPIKEFVDNSKENYLVAIGGDHYTSTRNGNHLNHNSPFIIYNNKNHKNIINSFSEKDIIKKSITKIFSYDLFNKLDEITR